MIDGNEMVYALNMDKVWKVSPLLKSYSRNLLSYLVYLDPLCMGVGIEQWKVMKATGLCQRSLQMAMDELREHRLLTFTYGQRPTVFKVTLT